MGIGDLDYYLVSRVFEQGLIVGAHIQADRQAQRWIHARHCRVQQYLPLRNGHAACSKISQSQYPLPISHHHYPAQ